MSALQHRASQPFETVSADAEANQSLTIYVCDVCKYLKLVSGCHYADRELTVS